MRKLSILAVALVAALAAGVLAVTIGFGSSHREAPLTSIDPTGDDTDVYAYTADDAKDALTVVANWIPFEDPAGGPNFYRFDDRATYYVNVDNTGDGAYDIRYEFKFTTHYTNPNSFLYALPGVSSIDDPKLQIKQTYDLYREVYRHKRLWSSKKLANDYPVAPNNVGPKTIPDYNAVANQAIKSLPGGGKVFVGQRDDPFFVDLGQTFDAINFRPNVGTGNKGGGKDDLAGYGVHAIVLQVPESAVTRDGKQVTGADDPEATVGVWSSTERPLLQVNGRHTAVNSRASSRRKSRRGNHAHSKTVQVSRLGNPLVNEVVIPVGQKDRFNRTQPQDDAANYGKYVVEPELAKVMNLLFPGLNVPETDRTDIVTALLTGIPGLNQISAKPAAADTLKLNLGIEPSKTPSRFGVLADDKAGFPNGRRLADDVTDIELRVVGGFLKGNKLPLGDGVDQNDKPFLSTFPYLPATDSGFDSKIKRIEPASPPVGGQP